MARNAYSGSSSPTICSSSPHQGSKLSGGEELFWKSSSPWDRRSSSERQEKVVPWSSLLGCTMKRDLGGLLLSTGCRPSSSSRAQKHHGEVRVPGGPPNTRQLRLRCLPTPAARGQGCQLHALGTEWRRVKGSRTYQPAWQPHRGGSPGWPSARTVNFKLINLLDLQVC